MRISTSMLHDLGVNAINNQLAQLVKTQQQLATGRRILAPEDDPVASASALQNEKALGVTKQHNENLATARSALGLEETVLSSTTRVFQAARQTVISAGNATLSASDRATLANTLRGNYEELLSLANSRDGQGNYMFAGFKTSTQPFTQTSGAAVYAGDQGQRKLQISDSRQIAVSDSGQDLFKPGVTGSDPFATIENFITALSTGAPVTALALSTALNELDTAMNNVLRIHSGIGSRLNELDASENNNLDSAFQYESTLSNLRDLDYTKAISDLTRQQATLEAAQKSFVRVQGLSLFNFI